MTFSEFGRRATGNGSFGSDHGTAAPMFVFGRYVNPGVIGNNADLGNLNNGNLQVQYDYRQVFTAALKDWLEADPMAIEATRFSEWVDSALPIVNVRPLSAKQEFMDARFQLRDCYPNPVKDRTTISYYINARGLVKIELLDVQGRPIKTLLEQVKDPGEHFLVTDLSGSVPGVYLYSMKAGDFQKTKRLVKV